MNYSLGVVIIKTFSRDPLSLTHTQHTQKIFLDIVLVFGVAKSVFLSLGKQMTFFFKDFNYFFVI